MLETYEPTKKSKISPEFTPTGIDAAIVLDHVTYSESNGLMSVFRTADIVDENGKIPQDEAYADANKLVNLSAALRKYASLAFLFFLWVDFYRSITLFFQTKNKNWKQYLSFTANSLATLGLTALYIFSIASIGTACAYVAPYLLAAVLGVKVIGSIVNFAKNIYYAYKTKDLAFLTEAAKQLLSIITYTFGLILTLVLGPQLDQINQDVQEEADLVRNGGDPDGLYNSLGSMKNLFSTYQPLIYGLGVTSAIALATDILIATYYLNRETLHDLKNVGQTIKDAWKEARNSKSPNLATAYFLLKGFAKAASLLLLPVHGFFGLAYKVNASMLDDLKKIELKNFKVSVKRALTHLRQAPLQTLGMSFVKVIFLPFLALYPFISGIINKKSKPRIGAVDAPRAKTLVDPTKQPLPENFLQNIVANRKESKKSISLPDITNAKELNATYGKQPAGRKSIFDPKQQSKQQPPPAGQHKANRPTIY